MAKAKKPVHYSQRKGKRSKKRVAGIVDPVYMKSVRDVASDMVTDMAGKVKKAVTRKPKPQFNKAGKAKQHKTDF
jgi:hypothetical protein